MSAGRKWGEVKFEINFGVCLKCLNRQIGGVMTRMTHPEDSPIGCRGLVNGSPTC